MHFYNTIVVQLHFWYILRNVLLITNTIYVFTYVTGNGCFRELQNELHIHIFVVEIHTSKKFLVYRKLGTYVKGDARIHSSVGAFLSCC